MFFKISTRDYDELIQLIAGLNLANTGIILNCQIGVGRSTFGTIMAVLIIRWLTKGEMFVQRSKKKQRHTYQVIHSLLRVIRNGIECKAIVDDAIDACGQLLNLRESIHECKTIKLISIVYQQYQNEKNPDTAGIYNARGITALQKYFDLIKFQSYLDSNPPGIISELISFGEWQRKYPELATISESIFCKEPNPLAPVTIFILRLGS